MELAKTRMKIVKTGSIGENKFFVACILSPKAKGNCQARNNLWRRKTEIYYTASSVRLVFWVEIIVRFQSAVYFFATLIFLLRLCSYVIRLKGVLCFEPIKLTF